MDNIIVAYAASEKLDGNAWDGMVAAVCCMKYEEAEAWLKGQEAMFKQEYGPIPNAYRSAKSVALGALKLGIGLYGDNGHPKGKSAIQAAIKDAKVPKNILKEWDAAFNRLANVYYSASAEDRAEMHSQLSAFVGE